MKARIVPSQNRILHAGSTYPVQLVRFAVSVRPELTAEGIRPYGANSCPRDRNRLQAVAVKNEDFNISKILILYPPPSSPICNPIDSD